MRTDETWQKRVFPRILKKLFPARLQEVLQQAQGWDKVPPLNNRFIWGDKGYGKTVLACQILIKGAKDHYLQNLPLPDAAFVTMTDFIYEVKSTFNGEHPKGWTETKVIDFYRSKDFLILDDIGAVKATDWVYQTLFLIVNHRYDHLKVTIFTSNNNLNELADVMGDDRVVSRIERMCITTKKKPYKK